MSIEAMKQALEFIIVNPLDTRTTGMSRLRNREDAITALHAAIAEQEKAEPVAEVVDAGGVCHFPKLQWKSANHSLETPIGAQLYTHPAPVPAGMVLVQEDQLKTLIQSITEMSHARRNPDWFTKGKQGAENQWFLWEHRGLEAIKTITAASKPGEMK